MTWYQTRFWSATVATIWGDAVAVLGLIFFRRNVVQRMKWVKKLWALGQVSAP